jgi:hypothetical protein
MTATATRTEPSDGQDTLTVVEVGTVINLLRNLIGGDYVFNDPIMYSMTKTLVLYANAQPGVSIDAIVENFTKLGGKVEVKIGGQTREKKQPMSFVLSILEDQTGIQVKSVSSLIQAGRRYVPRRFSGASK